LPAATLPTPGTLPATGEWPAVPPAPAPVKPSATATAPEPPLLISLPVFTSLSPRVVDESLEPVTAIPAVGTARAGDDSPTMAMPGRLGFGGSTAAPSGDIVWEPRFARVTAMAIFGVLTLLALPLWIVLYRLIGTTATTPAGPQVADLVALCMMLTGAYLAGAALWFILVEMRGRVRLVDAIARPAGRELPREELTSFSGIPRSYGQLPAQVAILALALALFVSATILSVS
jgi:hypothetical protein